MRIGMLGPLLAESGGRAVDIPGVRAKVLLIRLAMDPRRMISTESLLAAVWGEELPADPVHALHALVSRLRRALPDPSAVRSVPGGYLLEIAVTDVDVAEFEHLAREGREQLRAGRPQAAADLLRRALGLWRGDPLPEAYGTVFAEPVRVRLTELRLAVTEDRIAADLAVSRDAGELVAEAEALVAAHPLREVPRLLLLRALHAAGRAGEALAGYESYRKLLATELGADPGPELRAAHLAVLRGEPPAGRLPRGRGNIPAPVSALVGREDEQARLAALLNEHRLVTVTGTGGVGKTRLALSVAGSAGFAGGCWLVELAPVADPGSVAHAALSALGIPDEQVPGTTRRDAVTRLAEALPAVETLIVLDNCEHLLDAVAAMAATLLGRCPGLRVLVTSREPLGMAGEVLYPVRPLGLPGQEVLPEAALEFPAVGLFAQCAAAAGQPVTAGTAGLAAEVCRRLDGLPLAIELAAARLRSLPLHELAARVGSRLTLLGAGNRSAPARHRSLHAVIAWSWDLLDDAERLIAERAALFPGGITPESAAAISGLPEAACLDLLTALADKSLLQLRPGGGLRYRMLETIREFALARLSDTGTLRQAVGAQAEWALRLAEAAEPMLRGGGQLPWLAALTAEHDNLIAVLTSAREAGDCDTAVRLGAALGTFWLISDRHGEAASLQGQVLDVPGPAPATARAAAAAMWALNTVLYEGPSGEVRLAEPAGLDHPVAALLPAALALAADDLSGVDVAGDLLDHPDPWTRGMARLIRAFLLLNHGDLQRGMSELSASAAEFRPDGERWGLATALTFHGYLSMLTGAFAETVKELDEAVRLLGELCSGEAFSMQRGWLAEALWRSGDTGRARAQARELAESGTGSQAFYARKLLGDMARAAGDLAEAAGQYRLAERDLARLSPSAGWVSGFEAMLRASASLLASARDEQDLARADAVTAIELAAGAEDMILVAMVSVALARCLLGEQHAESAARVLGATDALRGTSDEFNPDVAALTGDLVAVLGEQRFLVARSEGSQLDRAAALALITGQARRR